MGFRWVGGWVEESAITSRADDGEGTRGRSQEMDMMFLSTAVDYSLPPPELNGTNEDGHRGTVATLVNTYFSFSIRFFASRMYVMTVQIGLKCSLSE